MESETSVTSGANAGRFPLVMKSTALITAVITALLAAVYRLYPLEWIFTAAISFGTTCFHFAMRLLVGAVVPRLTGNVPVEHWWFQHRRFEPALYKVLKIKAWKGNLPTYDPSQFDLRQNSLSQVVRNMCGAEIVHEVIMVCSFLPLLFAIPFGALPVFLITSVLAALYDSIFVMAQRYNRPRLMRILNKKEAKRL